MDKHRKLAEVLKGIGKMGLQSTIIAAEVISIEDESCTVKVGDLELSNVRLKATINGEENKILLLPRAGSKVLIGSLTGDLRDLCVLKIDEVEKLRYRQDGLEIEVDSTDKKVLVKNDAYSLLALLLEFIDISMNEIHMTNSGPTVSLNPTTKIKFEKLKNKFSKLLKN